MPKKPAPKRKRGRPPKLSNVKAHWKRAWSLAKSVDSHYAMRPEEQEVAFKHALALPKKAVIVELGVTHGKTGILLAYAADALSGTYTGVDNFSLEGSAKTVKKTLRDRKLTGTILEGNTADVPWKANIDYLLIDAGHDRLNIAADCDRWLPFLKPGALVLFHDYNPEIDESDPHYHVKYYADFHTKSWKQVDYVPYLSIRQKPDKNTRVL